MDLFAIERSLSLGTHCRICVTARPLRVSPPAGRFSESEPINMAALMTLLDEGEFRLDDRVRRFLLEFCGGGRGEVTVRHLLTHVSGLPDQLTENNELRRRHASLDEFVERTLRTPLGFAPRSRYEYSSCGVLLAVCKNRRLSLNAIGPAGRGGRNRSQE